MNLLHMERTLQICCNVLLFCKFVTNVHCKFVRLISKNLIALRSSYVSMLYKYTSARFILIVYFIINGNYCLMSIKRIKRRQIKSKSKYVNQKAIRGCRRYSDCSFVQLCRGLLFDNETFSWKSYTETVLEHPKPMTNPLCGCCSFESSTLGYRLNARHPARGTVNFCRYYA